MRKAACPGATASLKYHQIGMPEELTSFVNGHFEKGLGQGMGNADFVLRPAGRFGLKNKENIRLNFFPKEMTDTNHRKRKL
ncbi:MAG: hypothetical protein JRH12_04360 [Deltaproteobacteria bacterium]|jgi:hypothetical protein|nr:hypothetical protein [Deltaproteobacteria bacterium]MBW2478829.1 hypothetical protein [Deltaproteobacteria bacterium]